MYVLWPVIVLGFFYLLFSQSVISSGDPFRPLEFLVDPVAGGLLTLSLLVPTMFGWILIAYDLTWKKVEDAIFRF